MKRSVAATVAIFFCFTLAGGAEGNDRNIWNHPIWKRYGLEHLDVADKSKVWEMVEHIYLEASREKKFERSAIKYMEREGWKKRRIILLKIDGKECLVVENIWKYYTCELPIFFPRIGWSNGTYWVKDALILGGIDEMIDTNGQVVSFMFVSWNKM